MLFAATIVVALILFGVGMYMMVSTEDIIIHMLGVALIVVSLFIIMAIMLNWPF